MRKNGRDSSFSEAAIWLTIVGWIVFSWITHVVVCLSTASWGFLIAGAIMFPVAVVHGTGCWFGLW